MVRWVELLVLPDIRPLEESGLCALGLTAPETLHAVWCLN
jgi:hypothetical protein